MANRGELFFSSSSLLIVKSIGKLSLNVAHDTPGCSTGLSSVASDVISPPTVADSAATVCPRQKPVRTRKDRGIVASRVAVYAPLKLKR